MKSSGIYFFFILIVGAGLLSLLFIPSLSDYERHEKLSKNSSLLDFFSKPHSDYSASQVRKEIRKEMWFTQSTGRTHCQIDAPKSEIFISHSEQKELSERIYNSLCTFQEKLYEKDGIPMQQICVLQSEEALLSSLHHQLTGQDVSITRYYLPGHQIPKELTGNTTSMQGQAKTAQVLMDGKELKIHTEGFKASFTLGEK
jgi:hypothetical protein